MMFRVEIWSVLVHIWSRDIVLFPKYKYYGLILNQFCSIFLVQQVNSAKSGLYPGNMKFSTQNKG